MRVVASFTTLPSRYDILYQSMQSLLKNTIPPDVIYLAIPKRARRLNQEYPPLPEKIQQICTVVLMDQDYGPISKIYGALMSEDDPNTLILSCDDDVLFAQDHIAKLLIHHQQHPSAAICGTGALLRHGLWFISIVSSIPPFQNWRSFTGFDVDDRGRNIDLIFGVAGVLYSRGMFPHPDQLHEELFGYSLRESSLFYNDDVLISGFLSKHGIDRKVFLDIPSITQIDVDDALSQDLWVMLNRMNESITVAKSYGFFPQMEPLSIDETLAFRSAVLLIVIAFMILAVVYLLLNPIRPISLDF